MQEEHSDKSSMVDSDPQEATILDLFITLAKYKRLILGLPVAVAGISFVVALILPTWYAATTKIMPPQQSQSNAVAILGQLGAITGAATGQALGIKNPSDIYVAMLKSRTVVDALIERFDLKRVYGEDYVIDARKELSRNSTITVGREGVITIEVEDKDRNRAADIANSYVEELRNRTLNLAVSEAAQRRLFFENQLKQAKNELTTAELELKKFTQQAGLINPQGQVGLSVAAAASLRAQIAAKNIQLNGMRSFATEDNPDVQRTMQELVGLRRELGRMESDANANKGDVLVPFTKAPEVSLEYTRKYREMKYYETLYEVLAKQYEIARIDEAKDATLIQVLDTALPPERKSRPKRLLIVVVSTVLSFVLACLTAFWLEAINRTRATEKGARKLDLLRAYVLPRKLNEQPVPRQR